LSVHVQPVHLEPGHGQWIDGELNLPRQATERGVTFGKMSTKEGPHGATQVGQAPWLNASHLPDEVLGDRVERVLALAAHQSHVQHRLAHRDLQNHVPHRLAHGLLGAKGDVHASPSGLPEGDLVTHPSPLGTNVVRHEAEVAVWRHEGQHPCTHLPAPKPDAGVKADVVEQPRVHEGQAQVWHAAQLDAAESISTHVSLYLGRDDGAALVDDGVHLLDHVEVRLVVGVLDARAAPGHVGQLARREGGAQAGTARGDDVGWLDELLQDVRLRGQGEPIVQHLVQQLQDTHKVV
ncbi:unnamed protein product, partial [Ixodes pacificus]